MGSKCNRLDCGAEATHKVTTREKNGGGSIMWLCGPHGDDVEEHVVDAGGTVKFQELKGADA